MSHSTELFECNFDEEGIPISFPHDELEDVPDLWEQRAALFFTPTSEIPSAFIGSGNLRVRLPIVTPSYEEYENIPGYRNTRLWVDLIQRATGKIRWLPMDPVTITIIRKDVYRANRYAMVGAKALTDAFKVASTGRHDGHLVHYFGAIADDSPSNILAAIFECVDVSHFSEIGLEIEIRPWRPEDGHEVVEKLPGGQTMSIG